MSHPLAVLSRALPGLALDLLAPPSCAACDAPLRRRAVFCGACAHAVLPADPCNLGHHAPLEVVAFATFGGAVAEALWRLKYAGRSDLAGPLGELGRRAAREHRLAADLVVPVPLHPARLAERGFNQAALLGAAIARELGAPMEARALARVRHTAQQARLERAARHANVAGAFVARAPRRLQGKRIALVDDVCTTGATLAACAAALREAGAIEVTAVVIARAALDGRPVVAPHDQADSDGLSG